MSGTNIRLLQYSNIADKKTRELWWAVICENNKQQKVQVGVQKNNFILKFLSFFFVLDIPVDGTAQAQEMLPEVSYYEII